MNDEKLTGVSDLSSCTYYLMENEANHWLGEHDNIIEAMSDDSHIFVKAVRADMILSHMMETLQGSQGVYYDEESARNEEETPTHLDLMIELYNKFIELSGQNIYEQHEQCKVGQSVYLCTYDSWKIYLHADADELLIKAVNGEHELVLGMDSEEGLDSSVSGMETFIDEFVSNDYQMEVN